MNINNNITIEKNKICMCVSAFNEDLNWLENVDKYIKIKLYNKGNKSDIKDKYNAEILHNVGRESHTYLTYIINNYDNLPEYTIFIQGRPFDHSPKLYETLSNIITTNDKLEFKYISERIYNCKLSGCRLHSGLPLLKIYNDIFETNIIDKDFHFGAGAQFILHKSLILKHDINFYKKCLKYLDNDINPISGFVFERIWELIFQKTS